ncbi:MAG: transketolase C-terminal domain-containing protein [Bacteroidota bacterium]
MRIEFSITIQKIAKNDSRIIFLTGDLGFMALEGVREIMGSRFINAGVSEQNMISVAAGLASEGLIPFCYSIAPFAVFRPAEQIRLDIGLHNMNVKIVGNGGGYAYGIMGATHHALEDIAVVSSFQNFRCYIPYCNEDVQSTVQAMLEYNGPSYLRLGFGVVPPSIFRNDFAPIRKIASGNKITIVGLGPIILNAWKAIEQLEIHSLVDLFVVSEMPLIQLSEELILSLNHTKKLLVIEEHVSRGGLGENLALLILKHQLDCQFIHRYALGYPNGLYGNQAYHQKMCGLDSQSLVSDIKTLLK